MNRFPAPLIVELQANGRTGALITGFAYIDPDYGRIEVPPGFKTDFASVKPVRNLALLMILGGLVLSLLLPWIGQLISSLGLFALVLYAAVVNYGQAAAVLHDYIYATKMLPRKAGDQVFLNALRSSRNQRWRAALMWAGVRVGGAWRYGKTS